MSAVYNGFKDTIPVAVVNPFWDISLDDENYDAIHYLKSLGVITGYEGNIFGADDKISRQHLAAMITRSPIILVEKRGNTSFKDISSKNPYRDSIYKMYRMGIIDGSNGEFLPNNYITHIQMAKILSNLFNLEKFDEDTYTFKDVKSNHWGYMYVVNVVSTGVMPVNNSNFNPDSHVTRRQFAQYFYNALVYSYFNTQKNQGNF